VSLAHTKRSEGISCIGQVYTYVHITRKRPNHRTERKGGCVSFGGGEGGGGALAMRRVHIDRGPFMAQGPRGEVLTEEA